MPSEVIAAVRSAALPVSVVMTAAVTTPVVSASMAFRSAAAADVPVTVTS